MQSGALRAPICLPCGAGVRKRPHREKRAAPRGRATHGVPGAASALNGVPAGRRRLTATSARASLDPFPQDAVLQKIAAENNLSETAFCRRRGDAGRSFDLRWFTPTCEVDLCGHATLATAHVLMNDAAEGAAAGGGSSSSSSQGAAVLEFSTLKSGVLSVKALEDGRLQMDFPLYSNEPRPDLIEAAGQALGATPDELFWTPGNRDAVAIFGNPQVILDLQPNLSLLETLPFQAIITTAAGAAPQAHAPPENGSSDFVYRFFGPRIGIPEDPVTGSAQCSLCSVWAQRLGKDALYSRQLSQRGGDLWAEYVADAGGAGGGRVLVSGRAVTVIRGSLCVP